MLVCAPDDEAFVPIIDHLTLPDYRNIAWMELGREGIAIPGERAVVTASRAEGGRSDAGCISGYAYRLAGGKLFLQWRVHRPAVEAPVPGSQWGLVSARPADDPLGEPIVWKIWITMEAGAAGALSARWHVAVSHNAVWEEESLCVASCEGWFDADVVLEPDRISLQVNRGDTLSSEHDLYQSNFRIKWGSAQSLAGGADVSTVYRNIYLNNFPIPHEPDDLPSGPEDVRPGDGVHASWISRGTPDKPRATIGDILVLDDGRLYLTYTEYYTGDAWDRSPSRINRRISADDGRTWGEARTLLGGEGVKTLSSSLLHGQNGDLLMSFSVEHPDSIRLFADRIGQTVRADPNMDFSHHWFCRSSDHGEGWNQFVCITANDPYGGSAYNMNGRMLRLRDGRILQPCYGKGWRLVFCYLSDDDGRSWQRGRNSPDADFSSASREAAKWGVLEPCVVELLDGRLKMFVRSLTGFQYVCTSSDRGRTWSQPRPEPALPSGNSPAIVKSIPSTGDLLIVWNRCSIMERCPLNSAISRDGGQTWENVKQIERHRGYSYALPSMAFHKDSVLLLYMHYPVYRGLKRRFGTVSDKFHDVRFTSLPLDWFYRGQGASA